MSVDKEIQGLRNIAGAYERGATPGLAIELLQEADEVKIEDRIDEFRVMRATFEATLDRTEAALVAAQAALLAWDRYRAAPLGQGDLKGVVDAMDRLRWRLA